MHVRAAPAGAGRPARAAATPRVQPPRARAVELLRQVRDHSARRAERCAGGVAAPRARLVVAGSTRDSARVARPKPRVLVFYPACAAVPLRPRCAVPTPCQRWEGSVVPAWAGRGWARAWACVAVDRAGTGAGARQRGQKHDPQPEALAKAAPAAPMAVATHREQLRAQLLAQHGSARRVDGRARAAGMVDSTCSPASPEKVTSTLDMAGGNLFLVVSSSSSSSRPYR